MDVRSINEQLLAGEIDRPGLLPHLDDLQRAPVRFTVDFGLPELPAQPGLIMIRGARQYGKSTWLEQQIALTIERYGAGSALYLNGDELADAESLVAAVRQLVPLFSPRARAHRLFIDEVTAISGFAKALKRLVDAGELREVLVVTTGSKATDLRRGSELLPGRKGRLARTSYVFTAVSYAEFLRATKRHPGSDAMALYLLSGGSPLALGALHAQGHLPEYLVELTRDWILGEIGATGRARSALVSTMAVLTQRGGTPLGQTKLAREAGLANNTVAAGYLELLCDLLCIGDSQAWDEQHEKPLPRRPAKYPFINTLVAVSFHSVRMRSGADFRSLSAPEQAPWLEWLVAQEIWRRRCIAGERFPEQIPYWQSKLHELDFVCAPRDYLEVKRGRAGPLDFAWFSQTHPRARLTVLSASRFETQSMKGLTIEDFLLGGP